MKIRTSVLVLAVAAVVSWTLPGGRSATTQVAHEFLIGGTPSIVTAQVEPVQLAVLFQSVDR